MLTIFKRELKAYFHSPIAYVVMGLFIFLTSLFFMQTLTAQRAEFNTTISYMWLILVVLMPILTMRALAEERKNATEILLVTSPVSITSIVVGKYLAALGVFTIMTASTIIYPLILFTFGEPAVAQMVGGYIGFFLLGATFISIGIFASSLSENQVVSAVVSFVSIVVMLLMNLITSTVLNGKNVFENIAEKILGWFSLLERYEDFYNGILNSSHIVYYISFIIVFLFLTVRVIEKRRWSKG